MELFSIMQLPKFVPPWDALMEDLGHPKPELVARALGVGRSTVYRWHSGTRPPRVATLAVFWLTRWGRSEIDVRATNDALLSLQLARSLTDELAALRKAGAQRSTSRKAITDLCVVGTETSPPFARTTIAHAKSARVARPMPKKPKNPRKG